MLVIAKAGMRSAGGGGGLGIGIRLDNLEYDLSFSLFWGVVVLEMAELPEAGDGCEEA